MEDQANEQENDDPVEVVWSKYLGKSLYRLENIPYTEGFNLHDVVRCQERPNELPVVVEIVQHSSNRTLRVAFQEEVSDEAVGHILSELREKQVYYEKAIARLYMFNLEPSIDYEAVRDYLKSKQEEGLLWLYE
ncbi:MAG TPA: DUF4265 domain-containing protein [Anaerolineales bacterium]|nr:DUF4265 domain-containing protein [Anaerolineales bacterium]